MRVSKFIKAHKDILIEYIYDDGNNISEGYKILVNSRENSNSFVSSDTSSSNNTKLNQLFSLDKITSYYGIVNTDNYSFLQYKEFSAGFPTRFDTIKIHLPINYTFGEYIGCYVRVYTFDKDNKKEYNLSNFYYDQSDVSISGIISFTAPPIKFQEKLWGKSLNINIPSPYFISRQMSGTAPKNNSINANLTNGVGLSQNSPVFIDFSFLTQKKTINGITAYYTTSPKRLSLPQVPEFENLGVKIEHSKLGDFFEIYGIYNGNINDFKTFIDNSKITGNNYYVEYEITMFEQNIRGKTVRFTVTDNFNEKIEYRPIIKYTTTTAVIDVEMRLIDAVDDSMIYRRASYGMLQDEVSKYSLNLTKINVSKSNKLKIYSIKNGINLNASNGRGGTNGSNTQGVIFQKVVEVVKVDRSVLVDKFNLIAKSENVSIGKNIFYGIGKIKITLQPFDNVINFVIARDVSTEQTPGINNLGNLAFVKAPEYLDLTNMGEIVLVIKNDSIKFETGLHTSSNAIDLSKGFVLFKIPEVSMKDVKRIFDSGQNVFYILSKKDSETTVIYSGLFTIFDTQSNIDLINEQQAQIEKDVLSTETTDVLIDTYSQNTAIVYRRRVDSNPTPTPTIEVVDNGISKTSVSSTTKILGVTYTITENSSLVVDGYEWTTQQIKTVLNLPTNPVSLTFRTDSLFSADKYLDSVTFLSVKLQFKYIRTPEEKLNLEQTQTNFKNSNP